MGKAKILENMGSGQYRVEYLQDRARADEEKKKMLRSEKMAVDKIFALLNNDPKHERPGLMLRLENLRKQLKLFDKIPPNRALTTWCVDYTVNLSGTVGTIEINGDTEGTILLCPGYRAEDKAYETSDGVSQHKWAMTAEQWFYNEAMRPGWKKWMPTYRLGTITAKSHSLCTVMLDVARTSIVNYGETRSINQHDVLENVPIEYMNCDGSVFYVGNRVVVEFGNQMPAYPKVIGFTDHPKPTALPFVAFQAYKVGADYFLGMYDWNGSRVYTYDINAVNGTPSTWPILVVGSCEESNVVYIVCGRMQWLNKAMRPTAALCTVPITWEYPDNDIYEIGMVNHSEDLYTDDLLKMDYRTGVGPDGYFLAASGFSTEAYDYTRNVGTTLIGLFCDTWLNHSNLNVMTVINRRDRTSPNLMNS